MALFVPAILAVIVVLARSLATGHGAQLQPGGGDQAVVATSAPRKMPAVIAVVAGLLAGAAGGFISLEASYVGLIVAISGGWLLFRWASRNRWLALGGFLLGMGACAAGFLSPALTNHDPAVTYEPSAIPAFVVSAVLGLCGAAILVAASAASRRAGAV
ncbi:MAG: hypothetical protein ABI473_10770 [Candidatus Dormibacter sp.]